MDPSKTGRLIAKQRRMQNLTQEQLAQRIGVSNKTISKWENGKGMPDYALIQPLCEALGIRIGELIEGDVQQPRGDEERLMDLLRPTEDGSGCNSFFSRDRLFSASDSTSSYKR